MRDFLAGLKFGSHDAAHEWSVRNPEAFWTAFADYADVHWMRHWTGPVWDGQMPGRWFKGARLNYADHALDGRRTSRLAQEVRSVAAGFAEAGVRRGDVVAALLPNGPQAMVAALAAAWIGAPFTACSPEFGLDATIARLRPVKPSLLLSVDEYAHRDRTIDRRQTNADLAEALPSAGLVTVDGPGWAKLHRRPTLRPTAVSFAHPLWISYSSGTTGPPKALVHGHGGVVLDHLKVHRLYTGLRPGDRCRWLTSTGWTMWNHQLSGLLVGADVLPYAADPAWPDAHRGWRDAADARVTVFGVSPAYVALTRRLGPPPVSPALRRILSTGAPLTADDAEWLETATGVPVSQVSGGTDLAGEVMGDCLDFPRRHGWMNSVYLGADVRAVDGEMVIGTSMPNMPIRLVGDDDYSRYRDAYFPTPGVWHHGDRIEFDGGMVRVTGRSDATLNRNGIRLGTAELYAAVESVSGVTGSIAVHLEPTDSIVLFVSGTATDDELRSAIRTRLSPRFVPDEIRHVTVVPATANGKRPEVAVKRALLDGRPVEGLVP